MTLHGTSREDCRLQEFVIEAIDGSGRVDCVGFSKADLNVSRRNIPSKEEIRNYRHLRDIKFTELPDKQVYILIGSNVPEAHWVSKEIRGKRKEPYAAKGLLG